MAKKAGKHYVDNKKFYQALLDHQKAIRKAKRNKEEPPRTPEYIGECLLLIAQRMATKPNFVAYQFREDMVCDAVENGLLYLHNFDPKKSSNPFAYFSQITHYAFIRRIEREKKQLYTKLKYSLHKTRQNETYSTASGETYDVQDPAWATYENVHAFIAEYENKLTRQRPSRVIEDDDDVVSLDDDDEFRLDVFDTIETERDEDEPEPITEHDDYDERRARLDRHSPDEDDL